MGVPGPEDAKKWAEHFHFDRSKNRIVLAGAKEFLAPENYNASYNLVPGFQLIDRDFILRSDSTGHNPHDGLYTQLLSMVPQLQCAVRWLGWLFNPGLH